MSWNRTKRCTIISLVAVAATASGCGSLGGLGGLGGGGGGGGGLFGGPLGLIFNLAQGATEQFITILTDLIAPETQGDSYPTSPFKIVLPANLTPPLNGILLQPLVEATSAAALGPDNLIYFTEKGTGRVRRFNPAAPAEPEVLLDLPVNNIEDRGLIGIAFSPPGVVPARMFLTYVRSTTDADTGTEAEALESRVSSFPVDNIVPEAENVLFRFAPRDPGLIPSGLSGIGGVGVGPDGKLYFSHGDWFVRVGAQDLNPNNPAGKIHRVNLDGTIPEDNPHAADGSTVYANGFRYPRAFAWDSADGRMWASEFGNLVSDELNIIESGANYGYPLVQGNSNTNIENLFSLAGILYKAPTFDFGSVSPQPKPTSLLILRNAAYPADLQGNVLYAQSVIGGGIPFITPGTSKVSRVKFSDADFVVGWGDVWVAPESAGRVLVLVSAADGSILALCDTGIFRLDPPAP